MSAILSFDPGLSTGWSTWTFDDATPLTPVEHGTIKDGLRGFMQWWDKSWPAQHFRTYGGELIAEDYILDGRTRIPNTMPLEVLGALELLAHQRKIPLARPRNVMKVHAPDALLKAKGLLWKGEPHAMDSARHAIAHLKTRKHRPTLEWLHGGENGGDLLS